MIVALPLALLSLLPATRPLRPADCAHLPSVIEARAASNDNRAHAGTRRDGVLSLRIVAAPAAWYPDGAQGCALRVHAFAEEGKAPQIPGPLIRVRSGTEVHVVVRNALGKTLWIRGLQDHNVARLDSVAIAPGTSREFQFRATAPGAWYYWGGDANAAVPKSGVDGQLVGAYPPARMQSPLFTALPAVSRDTSPGCRFRLGSTRRGAEPLRMPIGARWYLECPPAAVWPAGIGPYPLGLIALPESS